MDRIVFFIVTLSMVLILRAVDNNNTVTILILSLYIIFTFLYKKIKDRVLFQKIINS